MEISCENNKNVDKKPVWRYQIFCQRTQIPLVSATHSAHRFKSVFFNGTKKQNYFQFLSIITVQIFFYKPESTGLYSVKSASRFQTSASHFQTSANIFNNSHSIIKH
jgi:hypothetical protein